MRQESNIRTAPVATEGGRRPTDQATGVTPPDPEVVPSRKRRTHTVAYKIRVLETVTRLKEEDYGAVGACLRKEGLYYSMVRRLESQQQNGSLIATGRGPKQRSKQALLEENKALRRKLEQVEARLAKTEMIVELQKKLSSMLDPEPGTNHGRSDAA